MNTSPNNESKETQADGTAAHPRTPEERHERSKRNVVAILATSAYLWGLILLLLVAVVYLSCR
jgi:fatty acid desaturase